MSSLGSKKALIIYLLLLTTIANAQENKQYDHIEKYTSFWHKLIPRYSKLQFAGSMGFLSVGPGWNYAKDRLETDVLFGFIPKNSGRRALTTFTLKQNYIPWQIRVGNISVLEPLSCGLYVNSILHRDFWISGPDKYPTHYYGFATKIRFHIFVGQRYTFLLNEQKYKRKSISLFYELNTCDLYLIYRISNSTLRLKDYLSLSFGIKVQFL